MGHEPLATFIFGNFYSLNSDFLEEKTIYAELARSSLLKWWDMILSVGIKTDNRPGQENWNLERSGTYDTFR